MPPAAVLSVTFSVPASMLPFPVRLPVVRLTVIAPLLVRISLSLITSSRACVIVIDSPAPVMLTATPETLVTINELF